MLASMRGATVAYVTYTQKAITGIGQFLWSAVGLVCQLFQQYQVARHQDLAGALTFANDFPRY